MMKGRITMSDGPIWLAATILGVLFGVAVALHRGDDEEGDR